MNNLGLRSLHLESYHPLGESKYAELGRRYACGATRTRWNRSAWSC